MESLMRINPPERSYDLGTIHPSMADFRLTFEDTGVIYIISEANMFYKELSHSDIQQIKGGVFVSLADEGHSIILDKAVCEAIASLFE